ncbi:hypothetical protein HK104_005117 [Borealophlyctis nickersoniae]|nr:hypothetical protein HK104_005117 [Borealophlyctis nickersoniae]
MSSKSEEPPNDDKLPAAQLAPNPVEDPVSLAHSEEPSPASLQHKMDILSLSDSQVVPPVVAVPGYRHVGAAPDVKEDMQRALDDEIEVVKDDHPARAAPPQDHSSIVSLTEVLKTGPDGEQPSPAAHSSDSRWVSAGREQELGHVTTSAAAFAPPLGSSPQRPAVRAPSPQPASASQAPDKTYRLKPITYTDPHTNVSRRLKVITQNRNGPCPLLALCNVLLLRGDLQIREEWEEVEYDWLVSVLGEMMLSRGEGTEIPMHRNTTPTATTPASPSLDAAANLDEVLNLLPTLQTGLTINLRFDTPFSFELTPALLVFDIFDVRLCHGWVVDPQDPETWRVVVDELGSYNRVVEMVCQADEVNAAVAARVRGKGKEREVEGEEEVIKAKEREEKIVHDGLICQTFLSTTASQLTYHGLASLHDSLPTPSLSVLFRNNHFLTLHKRMDGSLYTLVTDQGFVEAEGVVWETLRDVGGDSEFVDGSFRAPSPFAAEQPGLGSKGALGVGWEDYAELSAGGGGEVHGVASEDRDLALAMSLQDEENAAHDAFISHERQQRQEQQQQHQQQQRHEDQQRQRTPSDEKKKKKKDDKCLVM